MDRGAVRIWNAARGYGFIARDDGGSDIFVHITEVAGRELEVGRRVSFEAAIDARRGTPIAKNVVPE